MFNRIQCIYTMYIMHHNKIEKYRTLRSRLDLANYQAVTFFTDHDQTMVLLMHSLEHVLLLVKSQQHY